MNSPASTNASTQSDAASNATDPVAQAEREPDVGSSSLSAPPVNAALADPPAAEAKDPRMGESPKDHGKGAAARETEEPKVNVPVTEPSLPVEKKPSGPIAAGTSATGAVMKTGETDAVDREHGSSKKCTCLIQ